LSKYFALEGVSQYVYAGFEAVLFVRKPRATRASSSMRMPLSLHLQISAARAAVGCSPLRVIAASSLKMSSSHAAFSVAVATCALAVSRNSLGEAGPPFFCRAIAWRSLRRCTRLLTHVETAMPDVKVTTYLRGCRSTIEVERATAARSCLATVRLCAAVATAILDCSDCDCSGHGDMNAAAPAQLLTSSTTRTLMLQSCEIWCTTAAPGDRSSYVQVVKFGAQRLLLAIGPPTYKRACPSRCLH
jgi:hypothetical protein